MSLPIGQYALVPKPWAEVVEVPGLEWTGGAPMPVLIATEYRKLFACYLPTDDDRVVVTEVVRCTSIRFGLPNDEVIHGHPCGSGLMHYGVHVIHNSLWLAELRAIESVHPMAAKPAFPESQHYFLTFHDSSLEAVGLGLAVVGNFDSMTDAIAEMLRLADPH